ncbi:Gluconolactonase [Burkholderiales bacterium]|jgi:sugar lactone lactonase YvrE|nr:Gluconolactonase [Burkholderiales bacterium]
MSNESLRTALATLIDGLKFAEAPRWREGRLWFSDFFDERVYSCSLAGDRREEAQVPGRPSGLGWRPDGSLLVVSMRDQRLLRREGQTLHEVADLSAFAAGPCNDLLVDPKGRAYVGNFGFDLYARESPRTTCLVRVDTDGSVHRAAEDLMFPNGMALTPDGRTLIVAETHAHRLTAFDVDDLGRLSRRRAFAELDGAYPDGLCLDAEGAIWVADARGHAVLRVRQGQGVVQTVSTGQRHAYACMLGGEDGCTLFICTASGIGPAHAQAQQGRIEFVRVECPHAGLP